MWSQDVRQEYHQSKRSTYVGDTSGFDKIAVFNTLELDLSFDHNFIFCYWNWIEIFISSRLPGQNFK